MPPLHATSVSCALRVAPCCRATSGRPTPINPCLDTHGLGERDCAPKAATSVHECASMPRVWMKQGSCTSAKLT